MLLCIREQEYLAQPGLVALAFATFGGTECVMPGTAACMFCALAADCILKGGQR